jgi:cell wall-associated NlpC family hydrolase
VTYYGPIARTGSTPNVNATLSQVECLYPGSTTPAACPNAGGTNGSAASATGGIAAGNAIAGPLRMIVPGNQAKMVNGIAAAPANAPASVQNMIWTANNIIGLPYIWGGGHASFVAPGYDCSGTVSYALHGGSELGTPMDSTEFESWGSAARGRWVTVFANGGHAYMVIAGLRLDTSAADDPSDQQGPRWRPLRTNNAGFTVRHPGGL